MSLKHFNNPSCQLQERNTIMMTTSHTSVVAAEFCWTTAWQTSLPLSNADDVPYAAAKVHQWSWQISLVHQDETFWTSSWDRLRADLECLQRLQDSATDTDLSKPSSTSNYCISKSKTNTKPCWKWLKFVVQYGKFMFCKNCSIVLVCSVCFCSVYEALWIA